MLGPLSEKLLELSDSICLLPHTQTHYKPPTPHLQTHTHAQTLVSWTDDVTSCNCLWAPCKRYNNWELRACCQWALLHCHTQMHTYEHTHTFTHVLAGGAVPVFLLWQEMQAHVLPDLCTRAAWTSPQSFPGLSDGSLMCVWVCVCVCVWGMSNNVCPSLRVVLAYSLHHGLLCCTLCSN